MVTKLPGIDTSSLLRSGPPQNALIRHAQTSDLILQHSDLLEHDLETYDAPLMVARGFNSRLGSSLCEKTYRNLVGCDVTGNLPTHAYKHWGGAARVCTGES